MLSSLRSTFSAIVATFNTLMHDKFTKITLECDIRGSKLKI